MEFTVPVNYRVKLKEHEKRDKCLDPARELKNLWNMKVTVIIIGIGEPDMQNTAGEAGTN